MESLCNSVTAQLGMDYYIFWISLGGFGLFINSSHDSYQYEHSPEGQEEVLFCCKYDDSVYSLASVCGIFKLYAMEA